MDTTPFTIQFAHLGETETAEIQPCCREDNVVDYAVWIDDKLVFTIARRPGNDQRWVVALKNADDDFDDELVQNIGAEINKRSPKT